LEENGGILRFVHLLCKKVFQANFSDNGQLTYTFVFDTLKRLARQRFCHFVGSSLGLYGYIHCDFWNIIANSRFH
jgi:hypothetical protein